MGVFANVPQDKYENLSDEDKKLVDDYRNQEYDVDVQEREGNYSDVVGRDDNKAVEKTSTRKSTSTKNS